MTTPTGTSEYVLDLSQISLDDVSRLGGKNASLGEPFRALKYVRSFPHR